MNIKTPNPESFFRVGGRSLEDRMRIGGGNKTHKVVTWKVVNFSDIDALSSNVAAAKPHTTSHYRPPMPNKKHR